MELFSIQCTTCKARLVVKDESVIGDILSCPKCSSMVQVVPPVGWKRPGSGDSSPGELPAVVPAASPATAAPSETSTARTPSGKAPAKKVAAAAAAIPPALPPRPAPQPATAENTAHPVPADSALSTNATTASTPDVPAAAPSLFTAAVAWARTDRLLLASGLGGGVVLGAAVWLFVAAPSTAPIAVADRAESQASSTDAANVEQASQPTAQTPAANRPRPTDAAITSEAAVPTEPPPEEPQVVADMTPAAESNKTDSPADAPPETTEPEAATPAPVETAEAAATEEPGPALKLDPIRRSKIPPDLASVMPSAAATPPQELVPLEAEPDDESADSAGDPGPLSREQIDERLAVSLANVEFADVPLLHFTAFIADVSGVPVTLDDAALEKSGQGRKLPISVKLTRTTAGEALRAAIERAGLSLAVQDGRIVITVQP